MSIDALRELVAANAVWWAAEAEVIRTYWDAPHRTVETDRRWALRQAYKELWEGYLVAVRALAADLDALDAGVPGEAASGWLRMADDELRHYQAFIGLYATLGGEPPSSVMALRAAGEWPENAALMALRAEHRAADARLGRWAQRFTEGGYCALYREGMAIAARGGRDAAIAEACAAVYEDEIDHMGGALRALAGQGLRAADWDVLIAMSTAQCRQRVRMRQAQLTEPVGPERLEVLLRGACAPQSFDWRRAGFSD